MGCTDLSAAVVHHGRQRYPLLCLPMSKWRGGSVLELPAFHCFWKWEHECFQLDEAAELLRAHCAPCWFHVLLHDLRDKPNVRRLALDYLASASPNLCGGEP